MRVWTLALTRVLQLSDGTEKERRLTTSGFLTKQVKDQYCLKVPTSAGKLAFVYSYNRNRVLIRPARIEDAPQSVVLTSLLAHILCLADNPVSEASTSVSGRWNVRMLGIWT